LIMLVFPAYAGVIPQINKDVVVSWGLSRIRGGDPTRMRLQDRQSLSFPHTRG